MRPQIFLNLARRYSTRRTNPTCLLPFSCAVSLRNSRLWADCLQRARSGRESLVANTFDVELILGELRVLRRCWCGCLFFRQMARSITTRVRRLRKSVVSFTEAGVHCVDSLQSWQASSGLRANLEEAKRLVPSANLRRLGFYLLSRKLGPVLRPGRQAKKEAMKSILSYNQFLGLVASGYALLLCAYFGLVRSLERMRQAERKHAPVEPELRAFPVKQS